MHIERVTYKRNKNLGNYESETLEVSCILNESDNHHEAILYLMQTAHDSLGIEFNPEGEPAF